MQCSPVWKNKDDLFCSDSKVGDQLAVSLAAFLPELGTSNRKQIAALVVQLRPFKQGRCLVRARRTAKVCRTRLMTAFYTGGLTATRYRPVISAYSRRCPSVRQHRESDCERLYAQAPDYPKPQHQRSALDSTSHHPLVCKPLALLLRIWQCTSYSRRGSLTIKN